MQRSKRRNERLSLSHTLSFLFLSPAKRRDGESRKTGRSDLDKKKRKKEKNDGGGSVAEGGVSMS